ncbi:unnamed protein product [Effrenium voratum]|nr:unnamed protein product [Effrenium voratum]
MLSLSSANANKRHSPTENQPPSIMASERLRPELGPSVWTHPLVWLPLLALFNVGGFALLGACGLWAWAALAALVALLAALLLIVTWAMGPCHGNSTKAFHADSLCLAHGKIFMSRAPGRGSSVEQDLAEVKRQGVTCVVTLLSHDELQRVGLQRAVEVEGMSWLHLDLRDRWIPWDSEAYLMDLVLPLVDALQVANGSLGCLWSHV